jgi:hypothetical protein
MCPVIETRNTTDGEGQKFDRLWLLGIVVPEVLHNSAEGDAFHLADGALVTLIPPVVDLHKTLDQLIVQPTATTQLDWNVNIFRFRPFEEVGEEADADE